MQTLATANSPRAIQSSAAIRYPERLGSRPNCLLHELRGIEKTFEANEELFGEGEPADRIYKVLRGAVRCYKLLGDGRRKIDAFRLPGDIFGFEAAEEREYSADAISNVLVIAARRSALMERVPFDGEAIQELWAATAAELRRVRKHSLLLAKNSRQRLACFLLEMHRRFGSVKVLELPMTRADIADYLGLTVETVSRTMTDFEASGVIVLRMSRQIVLRDMNGLRRLNQ